MKVIYFLYFLIMLYAPPINAIDKISIANIALILSISTKTADPKHIRDNPTRQLGKLSLEDLLQTRAFANNIIQKTISILSPFYQHGVYRLKKATFGLSSTTIKCLNPNNRLDLGIKKDRDFLRT